MTCQFEDRLWEAAETREMPVELRDHIADCAHCREEWKLAQSAIRGFVEMQVVPAYSQTIHLPERRLSPWAHALRVASACAVIIVLIIAGFLLAHRGNDHRTSRELVHKDFIPSQTIPTTNSPRITKGKNGLMTIVSRRKKHNITRVHKQVVKTEIQTAKALPTIQTIIELPEEQTTYAMSLADVPIPPGMLEPLDAIAVDVETKFDNTRACLLADLPLQYAILPASEEQVRLLENLANHGSGL